jgi:thioredoxin 1
MQHGSSLPIVTDLEIPALLTANSGLVALEFGAAWCAPCRVMAPVVEAFARERPVVRALQIDSDANPATTIRYGVRGLPTLLLFRDGELVERVTGAIPLSQLRARLAPHLPSAG